MRFVLQPLAWWFGTALLGLPTAGCGADAGPAASTDTGATNDTTTPDGVNDTFEPPPLEMLVDQAAWLAVEPSADLVPAHRPAEIECSTEGFYTEENTFEVDTSICNYVSVTQGLRVPIAASDTIELSLWHGPLVSADVAEGHVALFIGSEMIWELVVPIPNPGGYHVVTLNPGIDAPAGTPIQFHLHNHGLNTWTLAYIGRY
jgi:hypothetical protein